AVAMMSAIGSNPMPLPSAKWILLLTLFAFQMPADAQSPTAGLSGTVLNSLESPVSDATVTLTNPRTNTSLTSNSNKAGEYRFDPQPPGKYEFSVQAAGYRQYVRHQIQIPETTIKMEVRLEGEKDDSPGSIAEGEAAIAAKPDDYVARF